jgi:hypothetical protein
MFAGVKLPFFAQGGIGDVLQFNNNKHDTIPLGIGAIE